MNAEISYDLVVTDEMSFVEGTYRMPGRDLQVFIFIPEPSITQPKIVTNEWPSRITGVVVKWPKSIRLNKSAVQETLSLQLGVKEWSDMRGPDPIQLR